MTAKQVATELKAKGIKYNNLSAGGTNGLVLRFSNPQDYLSAYEILKKTYKITDYSAPRKVRGTSGTMYNQAGQIGISW